MTQWFRPLAALPESDSHRTHHLLSFQFRGLLQSLPSLWEDRACKQYIDRKTSTHIKQTKKEKRNLMVKRRQPAFANATPISSSPSYFLPSTSLSLALGLKSVLTGIINSKSILNKETNKNILCQRRQASQHFSKIPNGLKLGLLGQNPKELKEQFLFCFFFFPKKRKRT